VNEHVAEFKPWEYFTNNIESVKISGNNFDEILIRTEGRRLVHN
jgi:hypothetical protein